jgi:aromatic ring-opening dioxygenase catalytic subunit (LigB family)
VVHGLEHVLSLVFEDIANIPVVKVSALQYLNLS